MLFCRVFGRLNPSRSPAVDTLRIVHHLRCEISIPVSPQSSCSPIYVLCLKAVLAPGRPGIATALSLAL
jgi:hypothetical protein